MIHKMKKIDPECRWCHKIVPLEVSMDGLIAWEDGLLIQDALPELTPGEREILITGTCSECFDKMFHDQAEDMGRNET